MYHTNFVNSCVIITYLATSKGLDASDYMWLIIFAVISKTRKSINGKGRPNADPTQGERQLREYQARR